jgi:hypothetical protein
VPSSIEVKGYPPFGATDVDIYIKPENFRETLAGDLSKKHAAVLASPSVRSRSRRPVAPTTAAAWKTIPSWYLLGTRDRAITPAAQRFMAGRTGATIEKVKASHPVVALPARYGRRADRGSRRSDQVSQR